MSAWGSADTAAAWLRSAERRNRMLGPATERMIALASVREGARVLDAGMGTGDLTLLVARRVGSSGSVVGVDAAQAMVDVATEAARASGLANVRTVRRDLGGHLGDLGAFDAALARNVVMLLDEPAAALACVRGVLRPGGRLVAVVWAELERNPFHAILIQAARARGRIPTPEPQVLRAFSLSDPKALARLVEGAGFTSVAVERVASSREQPSLTDAMTDVERGPLYRELFSLLDPASHRDAMAEIERGYAAFVGHDGAVAFPMESLVVVGAA